MLIKLIGTVIGLLICGAGIYYLVKERDDRESAKIYTTVSLLGGIISVVCALLMFI